MLINTSRDLRVFTICAVISIALCSCASVSPLNTVSVDSVVQHGEILVGTEVTVRGYLRFGDDTRNLWSSREVYLQVSEGFRTPDDPIWNRCLTLYDIGDHRARLTYLNGKEVAVTGVVQQVVPTLGDVTTSACNTLGISVRTVN